VFRKIFKAYEKKKNTHTQPGGVLGGGGGGGGGGGWQFCFDRLRYLTVHIGSFGIL